MRSTLRTGFWLAVLAGLFVAIGGWLGGSPGAIFGFALALVMNFVGYFASDRIVLERYEAREAGPRDQPRLHGIVSRVSEKAGLPMPKVYIVPEQAPNAFATGRSPKHAAVAVTAGILERLDDDQLEGVIAHELSHVKNRDTLTSTIAATFAGALAMVASSARYGSRGRDRQNPVALLLLVIGAPLAGLLIQMLVSRIREYAADRDGAALSGKPLSLAGALRTISQSSEQLPLFRGNAADAQLFIVSPCAGGLQKLFSTHPPLEERIRLLEEMAKQLPGGTSGSAR